MSTARNEAFHKELLALLKNQLQLIDSAARKAPLSNTQLAIDLDNNSKGGRTYSSTAAATVILNTIRAMEGFDKDSVFSVIRTNLMNFADKYKTHLESILANDSNNKAFLVSICKEAAAIRAAATPPKAATESSAATTKNLLSNLTGDGKTSGTATNAADVATTWDNFDADAPVSRTRHMNDPRTVLEIELNIALRSNGIDGMATDAKAVMDSIAIITRDAQFLEKLGAQANARPSTQPHINRDNAFEFTVHIKQLCNHLNDLKGNPTLQYEHLLGNFLRWKKDNLIIAGNDGKVHFSLAILDTPSTQAFLTKINKLVELCNPIVSKHIKNGAQLNPKTPDDTPTQTSTIKPIKK